MGGNHKILTTGLCAALVLAVNTTSATALVIPGRSEYESRERTYESRESERQTPSYYRQDGYIYSYPPEQQPERRENRLYYRDDGRKTYSHEPARRGYQDESAQSELQANQPERRIIRYHNPTRGSRYQRGSTGLRIPGREQTTKLRSGSTYAVASWYGWDFHGRRTANGEIYNMYKHTAAHKTLPFGTIVRVTNLSNGRQAIVRINDRGPFVNGRDIDLSYVTARDLGMLNSGVEEVRLEILSG